MNAKDGEIMVVVVQPDGATSVASLDFDAAVSQVQLLAPADTRPVEVPLVLLRLAIALLPESVSKFQAFKAYHTLKREEQAVNDRMAALAEPSNDELPF